LHYLNSRRSNMEIDLTGGKCPFILIKFKKALEENVGKKIVVIATDPNSQKDFKYYCDRKGINVAIEHRVPEGIYEYAIDLREMDVLEA